jgi:hypothetical protein
MEEEEEMVVLVEEVELEMVEVVEDLVVEVEEKEAMVALYY